MMKKKTMLSSLLLFLAACIWGFAFVAQSVGMDYMGPLTFNSVRFLIGGTVLLPLIYAQGCVRKSAASQHAPCAAGKENRDGRTGFAGAGQKNGVGITLKGGICCGLAICFASVFQQLGIQYTTVGKAGFITTLYIILVPLFGLFMHKKIPGKVWVSAAAAAVGLYLLCVTEGFVIGKGDMLVFVCAILFSIHILVIDYFSPKADGVALSCIQFYTAGILCGVGALLAEQPSWEQLMQGIVPVLYAGIMSCGVAYTLQIIGQKELEPTVASLILSMESAVSVLAGWLLLGQALTARELAGCVLVFAAVILVQIRPAEEP